ncbi:hypothetical protein RN001_013548 [Aquatica leii]|uniref:SET and MYND domain-containing protein 4 n=1 Tax=Aquatica leii TaxID=1421715 RepID=A0AAN7QDA7_9COLE|nr:hypothetical protein RN001_013548 [Aquatica leii]
MLTQSSSSHLSNGNDAQISPSSKEIRFTTTSTTIEPLSDDLLQRTSADSRPNSSTSTSLIHETANDSNLPVGTDNTEVGEESSFPKRRVSTLLKMAVFPVPRIRGANEREIYKNFVKDYPRNYVETLMSVALHDNFLKTKDNAKSVTLRLRANKVYLEDKNPQQCIQLYNKSLRYAIYNSENYGIVLANRSAMLFKIFQFKECIDDIDRCLQSQLPKVLKPKVYLRKCESYKKLGDQVKMNECVAEFLLFLNTEASKTDADRYNRKICSVLSSSEEVIELADDTCELPIMEPNLQLPNASVSVALRQHNKKNYYASGKKITEGQVLFVEKAYAFAPYTSKDHSMNKQFCQYCLKRLVAGVPCKTCVKYMYCSEACQSSAWREFHQWECLAIQARILAFFSEVNLALRILFKVCHNWVQQNTSDHTYLAINNFPLSLHDKHVLQVYAENAMMLVFYLKTKTNFFEYIKRSHNFRNKSDKDVMATIGGLLIRHATQIQSKELHVFDFSDVTFNEVAFAICPSVVYMSHSCDPNTVYYFHNDYVVVKALTDININTKLTYSYRNATRYTISLADRKSFLWDICRLRCNCQPCQNPMLNLEKLDSYICIRCRGPANIVNSELPEEQCKCLQCNHLFILPEFIKQIMLCALMYSNNNDDVNNIHMAVKSLAILKDFLNPYHMLYEAVYLQMMLSYIAKDDPIHAFEIFELLMDYSENRHGVKSSNNVILQMFSCKIILEYLTFTKTTLSIYFTTALNRLKKYLEKLTGLIELIYPPMLKEVKLFERQRLCLETRIVRLNSSHNSCSAM